jgi:transaldolase
MKFFLDTANIDEIREGVSLGIVDGVTTNPSLIAKEGVDYNNRLAEICEVCTGPVSAEVVATEAGGMVEEGRAFSKIADNIVVKIPLIEEGIKAVTRLSAENIKTNVTLCFSPLQALLAAKAGATYISPFIGRLDDKGHDGMELIQEIRRIYDNYGFETEILAASIRGPLHVLQSALIGADVVTLPFKVIKQLYQHPLTDEGLAKFLADWEKAQEALKNA